MYNQKNYVIVSDPSRDEFGAPNGFRPSAQFSWDDLLDMIDAVVYSKRTKQEYTLKELKPKLLNQLYQKRSRKKRWGKKLAA